VFVVGSLSINCFSCNVMDSRNSQVCPGREQITFQESSACRLLALSNGTVVQQGVSPVSLCKETHFNVLKRRISKKFRDGEAEAICCYSNGCNLNMNLAQESLEILPMPMKEEEIMQIREKAENIAKVKEIELNSINTLGRKLEVEKGFTGIQCFSCNLMDRREERNCPGGHLELHPGSVACRLLALSNGSVVQQMVTPLELCSERHRAVLKRRIAKKFGDGDGAVECCYTDGCNKDLEMSVQSRKWIKEPLSRTEMKVVMEKADFMLRGDHVRNQVSNSTSTLSPSIRARSLIPDPVYKSNCRIQRNEYFITNLVFIFSYEVLGTLTPMSVSSALII